MCISGYWPYVCGSGSIFEPFDQCWLYLPLNDSWFFSSQLPREVNYAASAFHEDWGIIMSGGYPYPGVDNITTTKGRNSVWQNILTFCLSNFSFKS